MYLQAAGVLLVFLYFSFLGLGSLLDPDSDKDLKEIYGKPVTEQLKIRKQLIAELETSQVRLQQKLFLEKDPILGYTGILPPASAMARMIASKDYIDSYRSILRGVPHRWPVRSPERVVTSGYGSRRNPFTGKSQFHGGIDLRARKGVPILSAGYGTVLRAGKAGGLGNMVEVLHPTGFRTIYAHMTEIKTTKGAWVDPGTVLGISGSTGYAKGAHLHYEIRLEGKRINPYRFLPVEDHYRLN